MLVARLSVFHKRRSLLRKNIRLAGGLQKIAPPRGAGWEPDLVNSSLRCCRFAVDVELNAIHTVLGISVTYDRSPLGTR
jgi:hypothetical protein